MSRTGRIAARTEAAERERLTREVASLKARVLVLTTRNAALEAENATLREQVSQPRETVQC